MRVALKTLINLQKTFVQLVRPLLGFSKALLRRCSANQDLSLVVMAEPMLLLFKLLAQPVCPSSLFSFVAMHNLMFKSMVEQKMKSMIKS